MELGARIPINSSGSPTLKRVVFHPISGKTVVLWSDSADGGKLKVNLVTGETVSGTFDSGYSLGTSGFPRYHWQAVYNPATGNIVVLLVNDTVYTFITVTITSEGVTFSTWQSINTERHDYFVSMACTPSGEIVVAVPSLLSPWNGRAWVWQEVGDGTFGHGAEVVFEWDRLDGGAQAVYDPSSGRVAIAYTKYTNTPAFVVAGLASGYTLTFGTPVAMSGNGAAYRSFGLGPSGLVMTVSAYAGNKIFPVTITDLIVTKGADVERTWDYKSAYFANGGGNLVALYLGYGDLLYFIGLSSEFVADGPQLVDDTYDVNFGQNIIYEPTTGRFLMLYGQGAQIYLRATIAAIPLFWTNFIGQTEIA